MSAYRVTRWCCMSGCCIECHKRGNHGDRDKRARVVQADNLSLQRAMQYLKGWQWYAPKIEEQHRDR